MNNIRITFVITLAFFLFCLSCIAININNYIDKKNFREDINLFIDKDVKYHVDECRIEDKIFYIKGWIAQKGVSRNITTTKVVVDDGKNLKAMKTDMHFRFDVMKMLNKLFSDKIEYWRIGFSATSTFEDFPLKHIYISYDNGKSKNLIEVDCDKIK